MIERDLMCAWEEFTSTIFLVQGEISKFPESDKNG